MRGGHAAFCVVVVVVLGCGGDSPIDPSSDVPSGMIAAPQVDLARLTPEVVSAHSDGALLELRLRDVSASSAILVVGRPHSLIVEGQETDRVELFDDGSHGDRVAGDRLYSRAGLLPPGSKAIRSSIIAAYSFIISGVQTLPMPPARDVRFALRAVDTLVLQPLSWTAPSPDMQVTEHVVTVQVDRDRWDLEMQSAVTRYFEEFPGDRDFVMVMLTPRVGTSSGFSVPVHAPFSGVGGDEGRLWEGLDFNDGGRLLSVATMFVDLWISSAVHGMAFCSWTHEFSHTWFAFLPSSMNLNANAHWTDENLLKTTAFGFGGNACRYNELELYLAGLLPMDSVSMSVASGLTVTDIAAVVGPRTPAWPNSQKHFTSALVLPVRAPLDGLALAYFDAIAREYGQEESVLGLTFEAATGGRATLEPRIPPAR